VINGDLLPIKIVKSQMISPNHTDSSGTLSKRNNNKLIKN